MNTQIPWILISISILLILGLIIFIYFRKKGVKREPDYRTLFILGIIWLPMGIPLKNYAFTAMGLAFMIIGLVNKDKWKEPEPLTPEKRKLILVLILIGILTFIAGIVAFFSFN